MDASDQIFLNTQYPEILFNWEFFLIANSSKQKLFLIRNSFKSDGIVLTTNSAEGYNSGFVGIFN